VINGERESHPQSNTTERGTVKFKGNAEGTELKKIPDTSQAERRLFRWSEGSAEKLPPEEGRKQRLNDRGGKDWHRSLQRKQRTEGGREGAVLHNEKTVTSH